MKQDVDPFRRLWALGYRRLIPIIPPHAEISEHSSLYRRVGTKQDSRGKSPGIRGQNGLWRGLDWLPYQADEQDLERWAAMGAGVGIKTGFENGDGVVLIDADTLDEASAIVIRDAIRRRFGRLPVRIGRAPKAGYVLRVSAPIQYQRIEFGARDDTGRLVDRVEILTVGRQFVDEGVHPGTGLPYTHPRGPLPPLDELLVVDPAELTALLEELRALLPAASDLVREGGKAAVSPEVLRGDPATVKKAIAALPNTSDLFPSRESYRDVGYTIKAALPDEPDLALELFHAWAGRWDEGTNDPAVVEADWRRMKPPFRRGASWLYELAAKHGPPGAFSAAEQWFEEVVDDAPLFSDDSSKPGKAATDTYPVLRIGDIVSRPPQRFLIARHIPEVSLGFLYSEPGTGKSFLALDMALHLSYGLQDWHGDALIADPETVVVYVASEGSYGFRNRIKAWLQEHRLTWESPRFVMIEKTINFMVAEDIDQLLRTVRNAVGLRPVLIIVDTVSRAMPGADENLQKEMTLFVRACDRLKEAFSCAVLGVHHAGKNGDMRGSTVLRGAGDFVFRLHRKIGATIGRLECEKQKDAPDGWEEAYRFDLVTLAPPVVDNSSKSFEGGTEGSDSGTRPEPPKEIAQTSLVPWRCESSGGPSTEVTPNLSGQILAAMRAAWVAGEPWNRKAQAGERYAIRRIVAGFGLDAYAAEELLSTWEKSGMIADLVLSTRNKKRGYRVMVDIAERNADNESGIFG